jgi:hypothetical protein
MTWSLKVHSAAKRESSLCSVRKTRTRPEGGPAGGVVPAPPGVRCAEAPPARAAAALARQRAGALALALGGAGAPAARAGDGDGSSAHWNSVHCAPLLLHTQNQLRKAAAACA